MNEPSVPGTQLGCAILNSRSFASLKGSVSEQTLKAIQDMGFENMTEIQVTSL